MSIPAPPGDYSADQWRRLNFVFKHCGLSNWRPDVVISPAQVRQVAVDFTIWFFFQGTGELLGPDGKVYPLRSGVCLCIFPGMEFEARQTGPDLLGDLYFHFDVYRNGNRLSPEQWPPCPFYFEVSDVSFYERSTRRILELFNRQYLPGFKETDNGLLEAECLLKSLLLGLIRNKIEKADSHAAGVDHHHRQVVSATLSALYESPTRFHSVEDLARSCGYSVSWFRTLCLKLTGEKPINLLVKARIEHAKNYLAHTGHTIGEIAEMLGYDNIYYFSRQFREVVGITASNYRKRYSRAAILQQEELRGDGVSD